MSPGHNSYNECPLCGNRKDTRSKICIICRSIKPEQLICSNCGSRKDYRAELCSKCNRQLRPNRKGKTQGFKYCAGYKYLYCPNHPYARQNYIQEHRVIMEQYLKCYLPFPEYIIHHINGIKDDNRLENLELLLPSEHTKKHLNALNGRDYMKKHGSPYRGKTWKIINGKRKWLCPPI